MEKRMTLKLYVEMENLVCTHIALSIPISYTSSTKQGRISKVKEKGFDKIMLGISVIA